MNESKRCACRQLPASVSWQLAPSANKNAAVRRALGWGLIDALQATPRPEQCCQRQVSIFHTLSLDAVAPHED